MLSKWDHYQELVTERKSCRACNGLTNPADCAGGFFDSSEIGPWTRWQGNLDALLMVVAQDWGDVASFQRQSGVDWDNSPTNRNLQILLGLIGHHISLPSKATGRGQLFFTNAILCLKSGTSQSAVYQGWFQNCARFLRSQVEIVKPQVVVCLGQHAYNALLESYNLKRSPFRRVVDSHQPMALSSGIWAFAVYHCGPRILNTHRKWADQERDWQCIGEWMRSNCRAG